MILDLETGYISPLINSLIKTELEQKEKITNLRDKIEKRTDEKTQILEEYTKSQEKIYIQTKQIKELEEKVSNYESQILKLKNKNINSKEVEKVMKKLKKEREKQWK